MTKNILKSIFLFVFVLIHNLSFSQFKELKFEHITIENGLSHNAVGAILMDSQGFMWFGTFDGLNKYDGYNFTIYRNISKDTTSIGANRIHCLLEDSKKRLWVGTRGGGLNLYEKKYDRFVRYKTDYNQIDNRHPISNDIRSIATDDFGNLWLATDKGLDLFNPEKGTFIHYRHNSKDAGTINSDNVTFVFVDSRKNVWVGTDAKEINRLNSEKESFTKLVYDANNHYSITKIYEDKDNDIWLGTEFGGLYMLSKSNNSFTQYNRSNGLKNNVIRDIYQDEMGIFWIATDGGGLHLFNKQSKQFRQYTLDESNSTSFSNPAAYSIYKDRQGIVWIGTVRGGINVYKQNKDRFGHYKHEPKNPNSLIYNNVLKIAVDPNNNVWLGTDGGGLNRFDRLRNLFTPYTSDNNSLTNNTITALCADRDNRIYIGCYGEGLNILDTKTGHFTRYQSNPSDINSISDNNLRKIFEDSEGNIWIGTEAGGLNFFDKNTGKFTHYEHDTKNQNSLSDNHIVDIAEDKKRNLWIATQGGGLNMWDRTQNIFVAYKHESTDTKSISGNYIRSLLVDNDGNLWAGADESGLNRFDSKTKSFTNYTQADGLPNNTILAIVEDNSHQLWLSTNKGLSCFNPKTDEFRNFDISDGLQSNQFLYTSAAKGADGMLYFGGINGFNVFHPDSIIRNQHVPTVVITSFKIFNKKVNIGENIGGNVILPQSLSETKEIVLTYRENAFSFEFAALDFSASNKNKYKYMLEGFDKDWNTCDASQRYASYTNLDAGTYIFRVRGSNNDGVWNDTDVTITIKIVLPFWRTWWFYIAILAGFAVAFYIYVKGREKAITHDKELLEEIVEERTLEVRKQTNEMLKQKEEILRRVEMDKIQNWLNEGLAKFSDILSKNKNDIEALSRDVVKNLIKFLEANQCAICIYNDRDPNHIHLEVVASFAYDQHRYNKRKLELTEGLTGACYTEQKTICISNLPDNYTKVESGLGEAVPKNLLLVPLKLEKIVLGVIEIASFKDFLGHQIEFVEKLAQNITSTIYVLRVNYETNCLLKQFQEQTEQLQAKEESLQQNMEELQATQEDFARREIELIQENEKLKAENTLLLTKKREDKDS